MTVEEQASWDGRAGTAGGAAFATALRTIVAERSMDLIAFAKAAELEPVVAEAILDGARRVSVSELARIAEAVRLRAFEFLQRAQLLSLEVYAVGLDPLYFLPEGQIRKDARIYMREINPRHAVPERDMLVRNPTLAALLKDDVLDARGKLEVELAYLLRAAIQRTGGPCEVTFQSFFFLLTFGAVATLAACSSHDGSRPPITASPSPSASPSASPTPTATPTTAPAAIHYTAIGASDAVGYGASVPCASPPTVAVPTCPGGTGYVPDLANSLAATGATVTLNDLGISGAVIGPDILATVNSYGALGSSDACQPRGASDSYPADFITAELPKLTGTETLVTIFAGGNDTNGIANAAACMSAASPPATTAQIQAFVSNEITAFGNDLASLVAQVHAKAPSAKIVVANLPNFSQIPVGLAQSAAAQQLLASISVGIDLNVIDPAGTAYGVPIVDLLCNPQSYVATNFYTDGFHPNDAGYTAFAQAFFAQITAKTPAAPSTSCSYASATARIVGAPVGPFRDFSRPPH